MYNYVCWKCKSGLVILNKWIIIKLCYLFIIRFFDKGLYCVYVIWMYVMNILIFILFEKKNNFLSFILFWLNIFNNKNWFVYVNIFNIDLFYYVFSVGFLFFWNKIDLIEKWLFKIWLFCFLLIFIFLLKKKCDFICNFCYDVGIMLWIMNGILL